jgi:transcriptional regulator with XRE-family HTH domain
MDRRSRLKIACLISGITIAEFAKKIGVADSAIHQTLNGHASKRINSEVDLFIQKQFSTFSQTMNEVPELQTADTESSKLHEQVPLRASTSPSASVEKRLSSYQPVPEHDEIQLKMRAHRIRKGCAIQEALLLNADPARLQETVETWTPQELSAHIQIVVDAYRSRVAECEAALRNLCRTVEAVEYELLGRTQEKHNCRIS